jgi:hypothetical protein
VTLRLVLYAGEAYRVSRASSAVRVLAGEAWVAFAGRDSIMGAGEELRLGPSRDVAVVSPVGLSPLVLEVLGGHSLEIAGKPPAAAGDAW